MKVGDLVQSSTVVVNEAFPWEDGVPIGIVLSNPETVEFDGTEPIEVVNVEWLGWNGLRENHAVEYLKVISDAETFDEMEEVMLAA